MSDHRDRAILKIDRNSTPSVNKRAQAVTNGMGADPNRFPAPNPPLADVQAQIAKVSAAEQVVETRTKGAAAARNVQRGILVGMLETQRAYVQSVCDANPEQAKAIIEAAGMVVATSPTRNEPLLEITGGVQSGTVDLDANATILTGKSGRKVFYNWQWTADGGKTFASAPATVQAKTTIANLTPLTMVGFRVSTTGAEGPGEWSPIVTVLVQ
jgi:hypothetical protein